MRRALVLTIEALGVLFALLALFIWARAITNNGRVFGAPVPPPRERVPRVPRRAVLETHWRDEVTWDATFNADQTYEAKPRVDKVKDGDVKAYEYGTWRIAKVDGKYVLTVHYYSGYTAGPMRTSYTWNGQRWRGSAYDLTPR